MNEPGSRRASIRPGMTVLIVQKQDQATGKLTPGVVQEILTRSSKHPHGIKVRLRTGQVGRVKQVVSPAEDPPRTEDVSSLRDAAAAERANGADGEGDA